MTRQREDGGATRRRGRGPVGKSESRGLDGGRDGTKSGWELGCWSGIPLSPLRAPATRRRGRARGPAGRRRGAASARGLRVLETASHLPALGSVVHGRLPKQQIII